MLSIEYEFLCVKIIDFGLLIRVVVGSKILYLLLNLGIKFYCVFEFFGMGRVVCMKVVDVCSFGFICWVIFYCDEFRFVIL